MSEWQPIETAPKDGTPILCFNELTGVYNSAYEKGRFPCGFWFGLGRWYPEPTHWCATEPPNLESNT